MKGKMYHVSNKPYCMDAAGIDFQVCDYYILLITTSAVAKKSCHWSFIVAVFLCSDRDLYRSCNDNKIHQWVNQQAAMHRSAESAAHKTERKVSQFIFRGCAGRQRQSAESLHFILIVQVSARESQFMVICLSQTEVLFNLANKLIKKLNFDYDLSAIAGETERKSLALKLGQCFFLFRWMIITSVVVTWDVFS